MASSAESLHGRLFTVKESEKLQSCIAKLHLRRSTVGALERRIAPASAQIFLNAAPEVLERQQALSWLGRLPAHMAETVLFE